MLRKDPEMRLAVLVTCFNRVKTTLSGLDALRAALDRIESLNYLIFLVDDASPDGTGSAVRKHHPEVHVIEGTGSLFWNGGMCLAYQTARRHGSFDAYLLFNDDVIVNPAGVAAMFGDFHEANARCASIIVGSTVSSKSFLTTYSGYRQTSWLRPRGVIAVPPDGTLRDIDMPNGNFVLVPGPFFEEIGGLDPGYVHGHGDIDLGLVAKRRGLKVFLARSPIGFCEDNAATYKSAGFAKRLALLRHSINRSGDFSHFVLKHRPLALYPVYMMVFHLKWLKSVLFS